MRRLLLLRLVTARFCATYHGADCCAFTAMTTDDFAEYGTSRSTRQAFPSPYRRPAWSGRRRRLREGSRVDAGGLLSPDLAFPLIPILLLRRLTLCRVEDWLLAGRQPREHECSHHRHRAC